MKKLNENHSITIKADKGNTVVVIEKEHYQNKVEVLIENNQFIKLKKDPNQEYHRITTNTIAIQKLTE